MAKCRTCGQVHIDWERPAGEGYCCGYRTPSEHYHQAYEELRACEGTATETMADKAQQQASSRIGGRGGRREARHEASVCPSRPATAGDMG